MATGSINQGNIVAVLVEFFFVAHFELHTLRSEKRAFELAVLLERLHQERRRVVVWVADEGRRQIFDDYLWTYQKLAFLPHVLWSPKLGEVDDAVVLVGEPANPNRATVLVVGDDLPPGPWAATFDAVHDLVVPGPAGEERRDFWDRWQKDPADTA
jgi:DNA polymerase IIIc chi subunit